MTDSSNDDQTRPGDGVPSDIDAQVPSDTAWELENQIPFDSDEAHDLTSAIVEAVATTEDLSPMEIKEPPLYEVLDIVALEDALFGPSDIDHHSRGSRLVEFMYRAHRIVIRSDGWVQVYRAVDE